MAKHNIRIGAKEQPKQTTSIYRVDKNDSVTFHNEGNATLTVTFTGESSPVCLPGHQDTENPLVIDAGQSKKYRVCKGESGENFSYTAQIAGYAAEDPIVIIETGYALTTPIVIIEVIAGAVLLLGGYLLGRWHANRARHRAPMRQA